MDDASKTKEQLVDEFTGMRSRVVELEAEVARSAAKAQQVASQYERLIIELAIVNEVGWAISSTAELNNVLEAVHRQIGCLLDVDNFCFSAYERVTNG